eukprot:2352471-Pyramimonas_sp.AAC.1
MLRRPFVDLNGIWVELKSNWNRAGVEQIREVGPRQAANTNIRSGGRASGADRLVIRLTMEHIFSSTQERHPCNENPCETRHSAPA